MSGLALMAWFQRNPKGKLRSQPFPYVTHEMSFDGERPLIYSLNTGDLWTATTEDMLKEWEQC